MVHAAGGMAVRIVDDPAVRRVVDDVIIGVVGRRALEEQTRLEKSVRAKIGEHGRPKVDLVDPVGEVHDLVDTGGADRRVEDEVVAAASAFESVVALGADEIVGAAAAIESVVLGTTEEMVVARLPIDGSRFAAVSVEVVAAFT